MESAAWLINTGASMRFHKTVLVALLPVLLSCCDGPAEEAGERLDSRVEQARQEAAELKLQVDKYRQEIDRARRELEETKQELESARAELKELRRNRDQVISDIQKLEQQGAGPPGEKE
jgi:septal ring factor EnvC (AmiA/AmiB activator)